MSELQQPGSVKHLNYLDAARGLAAIMVMVGHYINWTNDTVLKAKVSSLVFNASDAVSFFFVLSGFVLSYKYIILGQPLDIKKFYVNRLFRLWPAFFLTIVLNALSSVYRAGINTQNLAEAFIYDKSAFWEEAILMWSHPKFYVPGWTLVVEFTLSMFLPFALILAKKDRRILLWLVFVLLICSATAGYSYHAHFVAGMLLCSYYDDITGDSFRQTIWYRFRYLFLVAAAILFSARQLGRIWPVSQTYTNITNYFGINYFQYSGIASVIFMIAMFRSSLLQKILRHPILVFLGKISFGVYLMHWLLVCNIFFFWDDVQHYFPTYRSAFMTVLFLYVFASFLLATIVHYGVELPFIKLGKRIASKMKPSLTIE